MVTTNAVPYEFYAFLAKNLNSSKLKLCENSYNCCTFDGGKSTLANLRYQILKIFGGTMPPDPLEEVKLSVQIDRFLHLAVRSLPPYRS